LAYAHKKIARSNLKCAVGIRSSSAIIQTRLKSPNNRAASKTVVIRSSIEGHYVCMEELDIVKMKIFMTYSIYYFIFQFGGLAAFCEGISPTKLPHSDVTGHKQLLSFGAQNVTCCCTQQLNIILKLSGGPIARLPPQVVGQPTINDMACKLQKLVPVQKLYHVYARLVTREAQGGKPPANFFALLEKCVGDRTQF